ncbi:MULTISPECIES: deoxyribodipyrimidine photo-lyase [Stutzerimonas stutzeri subgroup]|jgi:deoxyribodipyrimidine photo-lyase|uniref:Deoxyribodipyrimidine photo-lyase n=2 Tax=Stutzerimonas stutzeri TaxID=316 RepID=A0A0D7E1V1_STUST|nr:MULTISPECIES: deoxyribodipyrimidine photo-lyase [Stutzerimonas stutzeri subgroup]WOF79467.1 deoxyribodipyrimidine photo-lyase [Pseudomonas sp. FeN3W]EME00546.1 deoxyribodipyrimidine photolyase [Stutzerimonas stutzeri NF13]KIZ34804.1 deoxyribodipyrimidine photolyase [Stutzerimonas stutzeri]MBK3883064.1 deoxyribodipyrimidine photo-lyase [Stutzerimonas stutzeri]MCQ4292285.1 deoxyribodipyrimidine photo-lyase [Stutzerimonas stutzeri]
MTQLFWLRSDLRTSDNTALAAAMAAGPTVALYLVTPRQWLAHDDAPCKVDFWLRNLAELSTRLGALNVPLLIREVDDWQAVPDALLNVCREHGMQRLHYNEEYGVNEQRRDQAVAARLEAADIRVRGYLDQLLFTPGSVQTQSGSYFKVFSQFRKACLARLSVSLPACEPVPAAQAPLGIASDPVPAAVTGFPRPTDYLRALWPAGEAFAQRRLAAFVEDDLNEYHQRRDLPAEPGTSQLSAYLATGVISIRQCLHAALGYNQGELDSGSTGATTWVNELLWREFYKHILVGYPRVSMHRAFRPETEALPWRRAPDELEAWQQGRTGFPIIDAAMRQMQETGWMHNRLRMVVAMFLSKNLLIDWREGERWFMRNLIDGDLAANNGGWQWSASTGTDSVPYFRLFNPISQSQRFDPDGQFLRRWLPELQHLSKRDVHNPSAHRSLFDVTEYPSPIVDLGASRARALDAFRNLPDAHA